MDFSVFDRERILWKKLLRDAQAGDKKAMERLCFYAEPILQDFFRVNVLRSRLGRDEIRGIACVANSSFLLGKNKYKRFKITFCWLMDPENFAKVLSGKYQDQFDEYDEWLDGEPLPSSLTGEADGSLMTRDERRQAIRELWNPQTPEKTEAARLLGIA